MTRSSRTPRPQPKSSTSVVDDLVVHATRIAKAYPDLYPHQTGGVAFLMSRRRAILADEMGLGKTRTAIVAAREHAPGGPFVVVCPASLKFNWRREIHAVEPDALVQVLDRDAVDPAARWIVVNYDRLNRHIDELERRTPAVVIVDEAHYIKNRTSQRSKTTLRLLGMASKSQADKATSAMAAYLLTGTPIANRPRDVFNLLRAVHHPISRNYVKFATRYCAAYHNGYGLVDEGASNVEELATLLSGVMLRRTKDEAMDLPPKVRTWLPLDLPTKRVASLEQRALDYLSANPARSGPTWITFLSTLNTARHQLAVMKATMTADFVEDCVEAGQKVVVFTGYKAVVDVLTERFGEASVALTGEHNAEQRDRAVRRFQHDDAVRVFIGNLQAAGTGITLTAGTHVVFNDLDWVPANHWQAEDRIHRIGQTRTAFATYLFVPGTLDGFVASLLESKANMISIIEQGAAANASLIDSLVELATGGGDLSGVIDGPVMREVTKHTLEVTDDPDVFMVGSTMVGDDFQMTFPSSKDPNVWYTVDVINGVAVCDCRGFQYGGNCKHVREALQSITS
jgi:SWI/SNF-related matrix-associated actin-dependent regulator of chromatin subfamily A-like protein 1